MKTYKCSKCKTVLPKTQLDPTKDHEEILDAWHDGEYVTNVVNDNFPTQPSHHSAYTLGSPSMSQVTLNGPFGAPSKSSILSQRKLKYHHPQASSNDNGPLFDNIEWTAAVLMGWRSHQRRLPEEEMSYDFRRHLFMGKRTDDHFKMRPRTKKEFAAETAFDRLWMPSNHEYKLSQKLLTGKFHLKDYGVLEDEKEKELTEPGWKKPTAQGKPYSKRFAHLLYGPGSKRDPKNKGYAVIEPRRPVPKLMSGADLDASTVGSTVSGDTVGTAGGKGIGTDALASSLVGEEGRSAAKKPHALAPVVGTARGTTGSRLPSRETKFRPFRSTGGEDRPHYVDRARDLRRMKT